MQRDGASASVTRASVSRTLRRLWTAGLVELEDVAGRTLTAEAERLQRRLADAVTAQPDVAYRAYLERLRRNGQRDRYGSATRYAASWRATARRVLISGCVRST